MTTAIVTDSNASLPKSVIEGLLLFVVPLEIHHDNQVFRDGIDITPAEFYELQRTAKVLPRTSAPSPGAFVEAYQKAAQTADNVICITLSSRLSSTYQAAETAIASLDESLRRRVFLVDSLSAGTAQGLIALAAARAARDEAPPLEHLISMVERWKASTRLYGYLQSLYYVWKGGRVPRAVMWMTDLLDIKPVLQLADGRIGMVERPRTERRAMDRLVTLALRNANGSPCRIAVMHANAPEQAEALRERLQTELAPSELFVTEFTPVIGAHTGPGLVGFAVQSP
jgi:DegV family protein with EDD domain